MTINGIPFWLRECSFQSIYYEPTDRIICTSCGWKGGIFFLFCSGLATRKSLTSLCFFLFFLFPTSLSGGDGEVLSGAGRPVGGEGPEGDPVLRCLQLLWHCSVDQRWLGSGHWRGPAGWDIIQPPWASSSVSGVWLRCRFTADSHTLWLELLKSNKKNHVLCTKKSLHFFLCLMLMGVWSQLRHSSIHFQIPAWSGWWESTGAAYQLFRKLIAESHRKSTI